MSTDRSKDRLADPAEHLPLHPARAAISIGAIVDADLVWLADDLSTSTVSS